jgi:C5a peptidase
LERDLEEDPERLDDDRDDPEPERLEAAERDEPEPERDDAEREEPERLEAERDEPEPERDDADRDEPEPERDDADRDEPERDEPDPERDEPERDDEPEPDRDDDERAELARALLAREPELRDPLDERLEPFDVLRERLDEERRVVDPPLRRSAAGISSLATAFASCGICFSRNFAIRSSSRRMPRASLAVSLSLTASASASIPV